MSAHGHNLVSVVNYCAVEFCIELYYLFEEPEGTEIFTNYFKSLLCDLTKLIKCADQRLDFWTDQS